MKPIDLHLKLADSYLDLLANLSIEAKTAFMTKLAASLKSPEKPKKMLSEYLGVWESDENAEQMIESIRQSRTFNRKIEDL